MAKFIKYIGMKRFLKVLAFFIFVSWLLTLFISIPTIPSQERSTSEDSSVTSSPLFEVALEESLSDLTNNTFPQNTNYQLLSDISDIVVCFQGTICPLGTVCLLGTIGPINTIGPVNCICPLGTICPYGTIITCRYGSIGQYIPQCPCSIGPIFDQNWWREYYKFGLSVDTPYIRGDNHVFYGLNINPIKDAPYLVDMIMGNSSLVP